MGPRHASRHNRLLAGRDPRLPQRPIAPDGWQDLMNADVTGSAMAMPEPFNGINRLLPAHREYWVV